MPHANLHVPPGFTTELVKDLEKYREGERLKSGQEMLAALEANARSTGVEFQNLVVVGDSPYEQIIDNAEKNDCDLIMMASHARRGLDAMLLGSETVRVLKHTKLPVLVVH
ncbi:universal stress protein UspE [compost metagenome]